MSIQFFYIDIKFIYTDTLMIAFSYCFDLTAILSELTLHTKSAINKAYTTLFIL